MNLRKITNISIFMNINHLLLNISREILRKHNSPSHLLKSTSNAYSVIFISIRSKQKNNKLWGQMFNFTAHVIYDISSNHKPWFRFSPTSQLGAFQMMTMVYSRSWKRSTCLREGAESSTRPLVGCRSWGSFFRYLSAPITFLSTDLQINQHISQKSTAATAQFIS